MLHLKQADLEYLLFNDFEKIKDNDFFQSQEILFGQSICDLCLNDPVSIKKALRIKKG